MNARRRGGARMFGRVFRRMPRLIVVATTIGSLVLSGCQSLPLREHVPESEASDIPRELQKVSIPPYRVEPPDILSIEIVSNIRPASDPLRAGDDVEINGSNLFKVPPAPEGQAGDIAYEQWHDEYVKYQIRGMYRIATDGTVDLGPIYKPVKIEGLTVGQAKEAIEDHLKHGENQLENAEVTVRLPNVNGKQLVSGEHLIRPDGTVSLGVYGSVYVAGMTLDEVKQSVETHLSRYIHQPEIAVDVLAYNSKVIYVVTDGGGSGETVARIPFTGNEAVIDAISQIDGLSEVSSKCIWVARPSPAGNLVAQRMPVDWRAITEDGIPTTNYQLFPGDRIYIKADSMIAMDNFVAKTISPFQRIMGFILLGNGMVRTLQQGSNNGGGGTGTGTGGGFF